MGWAINFQNMISKIWDAQTESRDNLINSLVSDGFKAQDEING